MKKVRVLIVDDSGLARALLRELLESDAQIEVVGEAEDGLEALAKIVELTPDVVTMDLEMPRMGGLEAIEEIMASRAVPILVVSSHADAQRAYEAVSHGALEVIGKPDVEQASARDFAAKVKLLAGVKVIKHIRARTAPFPPVPAPASAPAAAPIAVPIAVPGADEEPALLSPANVELLAVVASTGGPQALAALLAALPPDLPVPVVIAQHIADGFAAGMAEWLDGLCPLRVQLAAEGEPLRPGHVYISPSEVNFTVSPARRVALQPRTEGQIYRPSCDALLDSVARVYGRRAVGAILTGMGSDGARGMEQLRAAGGVTLAQDEQSSLIYGMNRVAVERGAITRVLPLEGLIATLVELAREPVAA